MKNNYGNYVVQKSLKLSSGDCQKKIIKVINNNISKITDLKIKLKWKSIVENYTEQKDVENFHRTRKKSFNSNNSNNYNRGYNISQGLFSQNKYFIFNLAVKHWTKTTIAGFYINSKVL